MKKNDVTSFVISLKEDLENFEHYQISYSPTLEKTDGEWLNSFLSFAGLSDDELDSDLDEEYLDSDDDDDEYGYADSHYEELVNRRKYRSFRDDDSY